MNILLNLFYIITFFVVSGGALMLLYYPLAIIAEFRPKPPPVFDNPTPLVSIIVPAYNEEKVIANCVESIINCGYENMEIKLVDDGSTDRTLEIMRNYEDQPNVQVISQVNNGKAAALNRGFQQSDGEILFFVDADGMFTPSTIPEMLKAFTSEKVGAVCGNDHPRNLNNPLTKLYCLQTHVGTGFVRRALAEINCLPIVSGNCGAFRRSALSWPFLRLGKKAEPYLKGFVGEDLELTWRIHKAGFRVNFAPRAIILTEVPSTVSMLWKQRVRWARGLLQTVVLHKEMFFNFKYGSLGLYLPINFYSMVINPILQLLIILLMLIFIIAGYSPIPLDILSLLLWLGVGGSIFTVFFAIALNRDWEDLKYIYVVPLWVPYSMLMNIVAIWSIVLEVQGKEAKWNKFDRTGIISGDSKTRIDPSKGQTGINNDLQMEGNKHDPTEVISEYARIVDELVNDPTGLRYDSKMKAKKLDQADVFIWDPAIIDEFMEDQNGSSRALNVNENKLDQAEVFLWDPAIIDEFMEDQNGSSRALNVNENKLDQPEDISSDPGTKDEPSVDQTGISKDSQLKSNKLEWKVVTSKDSNIAAKKPKGRTGKSEDVKMKGNKLEWIAVASRDSKINAEPPEDQTGLGKDM